MDFGSLVSALGVLCGVPILYGAFWFWVGRKSAEFVIHRRNEDVRLSGTVSNRAVRAPQPQVPVKRDIP